ncbi:extracellular solute-binding protein [Streptosporangium carneum]|uniref:ABC transporter substrate-binding protein n=1 Tax=Streptosporangium carneum TaxID=47481 RepID=A0A9W6I5Y7_9ACTN|nr:extracellular solute-binding protein [Streptosporangium carneum]GLK12307.1 ABC transporter substrate-binding protein [Streptosporangium carneum]
MKSRTVVDVWLADLTFPGYMDPLIRLGEAFERAHPEYRINIEGHHYRRIAEEVHHAAERGRPPAVAEYYYSGTLAARDALTRDGRPLFTSVEKAVAGRKEILGEPVVLDDIEPPLRDYYTYDGDLTSMPTVATTSLLYTNTTLLNAAGVSRVPRTWNELEAACEAVARLPQGPPHAVTWANHGTLFQQAIAMQGGLLADHGNGRSGRPLTVNLASEEMLAWARWWRRLHREGHYLHSGKTADWLGTFQAFATQQVVFRFSSSIDVTNTVQAGENGGFGVEVSRLPYNDDVPYGGNVIAGTSLWLADGLDQATQDGALAFMQYLNSPANAAEWHKSTSFIPITRASFDLLEGEGWFDKHPYHRVAGDQVNGAHGAPGSLGALLGDFAGTHDAMTQAMDDVLSRGADPAARFAQANEEAQRRLDRYHADCRGPGPRGPHCFAVD